MEENNKTTKNSGGDAVDYGSRVLVVPCGAALRFGSASKKEILALMYRLALLQGWGENAAAEAFGEPGGDADALLAVWRSAGVLTDGKDIASEAAVREKPKKSKKTEALLPAYSTNELCGILERHCDAPRIIDECERVLGKMFSTSETGKIIGLIDYLDLDGEYIVNLCAHCARIGKKSLRYVETVAFDLYDRGITSVEALDDYLRVIEEASKLEGKIRAMFGMNRDRALTTRERKFIDTWVGKFGYDIDVIGKAYEITVNATGNASLPYANAILETWDTAGLRTADDVDAYIAAKNAVQGKSGGVPEGTSFNTDEFFEAALRRSYGAGANMPDIPPAGGNSGKGKK